MNAMVSALSRWLVQRRKAKSIRVIDQAPLFGGSVVHVIDIDGHRLVVATSPGVICLLTQFEGASADIRREEASNQCADICSGRPCATGPVDEL